MGILCLGHAPLTDENFGSTPVIIEISATPLSTVPKARFPR